MRDYSYDSVVPFCTRNASVISCGRLQVSVLIRDGREPEMAKFEHHLPP